MSAEDGPRAQFGVTWHFKPWLDGTVEFRLTLDGGRWVRLDLTPDLWNEIKAVGDQQMRGAKHLAKAMKK